MQKSTMGLSWAPKMCQDYSGLSKVLGESIGLVFLGHVEHS